MCRTIEVKVAKLPQNKREKAPNEMEKKTKVELQKKQKKNWKNCKFSDLNETVSASKVGLSLLGQTQD